MMDEISDVILLREWLTSLLSGVDSLLDEGAKEKLLEACGRACAAHHGSIESARAIATRTSDIDEQLKLVNHGIPWCGQWQRGDGSIFAVCESCGCPLVREGLIPLSPTLCNCSRGYVKAVFEAIWASSVSVELVQAIGRGDPVCCFVVRAQ